MNGAYSLLGEAASAVAEISALIWRISRSSVDGCITFSFDRGADQMIPDFGSAQVGKSPELRASRNLAGQFPQYRMSMRFHMIDFTV